MKPADVIKQIQIKLDVPINVSALYQWEQEGLIGTVPLTDTLRKDYTESNLKKILIVVLLKQIMLTNDEIKRYFNRDKDIKEYIKTRLNNYDGKYLNYLQEIIGE